MIPVSKSIPTDATRTFQRCLAFLSLSMPSNRSTGTALRRLPLIRLVETQVKSDRSLDGALGRYQKVFDCARYSQAQPAALLHHNLPSLITPAKALINQQGTLLSPTSPSFLTPSHSLHPSFNRTPNILHNLPVPPALRPLINLHGQHPSTPPFHSVRHNLALPAHVHT